MEDKKIYIFDLDRTLCIKTDDGNYLNAEPLRDRIKKVNELFFQGHKIIIYTSRGMGRFDGNERKANEAFFDLTYKQLLEWGCRFDQLKLGKISYHHWIDDKAINDKEFFGDK